MVIAKRGQDVEEALWTERKGVAEQAEQDATTAWNTAKDAVTAAEEQVTTRSWLFSTLGLMDATQYAANCNSVAMPCEIVETVSVA